MTKTFKKGDVIRTFQVTDLRVITTIYVDGKSVSNPTYEQFYADGWEDYVAPEPTPYVPTYSELVEQYIREHGYPTYGAELAVINNYTENPTEYTDAWLVYQGVREAAKEWAESQPHTEG